MSQHQERGRTVGNVCELCASKRRRKFDLGEKPHLSSFCAFYGTGSIHELRLPPQFVERFKAQLQENTVLEGPTGRIWPVRFEKDKFTKGWAYFVRDNDVKVGTFLTFSMSFSSYFEVTIFDAVSTEVQAPSKVEHL